MIFSRGYTSVPPGDLSNPGTEPRSATLQEDSLLSETPGMPNNTGVGGLSLLLGIFLAEESNQVCCLKMDSLPSELPEKLQ